MMDDILDSALISNQESEKVDFKEFLDVSSKGEWCEIIKDIVAMVNSGGGVILIGVNDDGSVSDVDVSHVLRYDPANLTDKMFSYTGQHFGEFRIISAQKDSKPIAAIQVGQVSIPLVFTSPGNYQGRDGKPKCAFSAGTVYFRHGAKSQPCTSEDLRNFLNREIERVKEWWLSGIRKVVEAPEGSQIMILPANAATHTGNVLPAVSLVDDPNAPAHQLLDPNKTHPFRQIDVMREFNNRLKEQKMINPHDVYCVRRIHHTDENPRFFYKPIHNSPQYSLEFVDWLIQKYQENEDFFGEARANMHEVIIEQNRRKAKKKPHQRANNTISEAIAIKSDTVSESSV